MANFRFFTGLSQESQEENNNRFISFTDEQLHEMTVKKLSKNTDLSTRLGVTLLEIFCKGLNIDFPAESSCKENLNLLLMKFYAGARTEKGDKYKNNSMISFRHSIQRHFIDTKDINIIDDSDFVPANNLFVNILKEGKKTGKGATDHYPEIEPEDMRKLNHSFDTTTPTGLLEHVWFNIMFRLIRRGRENLRNMNKNTFGVGKDGNGNKYVYQSESELDKNHGVTDNSFETTGEGRIYETKDNNCPVKSFLSYISHLHPLQEALWQRPRDTTKSSDIIWFCNVPLGEKYLGGMMSRLSQKYNLSQRYTNHSLRVTSLQVLEDNCIEGRHIIRVSGHKTTDSISNYARRLSAARKRNISNIFSDYLSTDVDSKPISAKKVNIADGQSESSSSNDHVVPQEVIDFEVQDINNDASVISDSDLVSLPDNLFTYPPPQHKPTPRHSNQCSITVIIAPLP